MEAIAAALLGHVHRLIGVAQQRVGVVVVPRRERDANAGKDVDGLAVDRIRHGNRDQDPVQGRMQLVHAANMSQHQDELIPGQPRHDVFATHDAAQTPGDFHQQPIAAGMAISVVDGFEAIEVEHAYGQGQVFHPGKL
jgi:hypothetical protein